MVTITKPNTEQPVKTALTNSQKERIYRFRYEIEVAELGKRPVGTNDQHRIVYDDLDETGTHYFVESEGRILAVARRNSFHNSRISEPLRQAFQLDAFRDWSGHQLGMTSRLIVAPIARGSLYRTVLKKAFEDGRSNGTLFEFQYCREPLARLYFRMGFRQLGKAFDLNDQTFVPMVLVTTDINHLEASGSPFREVARQFPLGDSSNWFKNQFKHLDELETAMPCRRCRNCASCPKRTSNITQRQPAR